MPSKVWGEIICATVEVLGWISNIIPRFIMDIITYTKNNKLQSVCRRLAIYCAFEIDGLVQENKANPVNWQWSYVLLALTNRDGQESTRKFVSLHIAMLLIAVLHKLIGPRDI